GVDREVIDSLRGLMFEGIENDFRRQVFDLAADDHRINGNGADGDGAGANDGVAGGVQVAAGGKVHHGVGAPLLGPAKFLDFLCGAGTDRRSAHVGVHLGEAGPANGHGVEVVAEVNLVGGDDHAAGGDLIANLGRGQVPLALGDALHLR